jgi:Tfp pilus assembly protein PilV
MDSLTVKKQQWPKELKGSNAVCHIDYYYNSARQIPYVSYSQY